MKKCLNRNKSFQKIHGMAYNRQQLTCNKSIYFWRHNDVWNIIEELFEKDPNTIHSKKLSSA